VRGAAPKPVFEDQENADETEETTQADEPAAEAETDEKDNDVQAETPADEEDVAVEDTQKQKKKKK